MDEKLIRDALGSPVPQHYNEELDMFTVNTLDGSTVTNGDIDFSQTKLLRDRLGSVIPQVWDAQNHKWVVVTTQSAGGNSGGEGGSVTWDNIQGKPSEFTPSTHTHEIDEINGLQERLDEVFTQVSSGKSSLETAIVQKGATVNKAGNVATFEELRKGILAIEGGDRGNDLATLLFSTPNYTDFGGNLTPEQAVTFVGLKIQEGARYFCIITNSFIRPENPNSIGSIYLFSTTGTYINIDDKGIVTSDGNMYSCDSSSKDAGTFNRQRGSTVNFSSYKPVLGCEEYRVN